MPLLYLILVFSTSLLFASNIFEIRDQKGQLQHREKLYHTPPNAYLSQKESEYSLQALYDELKYAERQARKAQKIHQQAQQINTSITDAKKYKKRYTLNASEREILIKDAQYYKGGRYVWGGSTPEGFDCSGYVQYLYHKHHVSLPRTAWAQSKVGQAIRMRDLKKGDLLFFLTDKSRGIPVTHVGIYLGNGEFIHAASKKQGIIVSPLTHGHYAKTFVFAKRVLSSS